MPTLDWIGKDKVVTHHNDVPYRVLDRKYTFGDTPDSGNMIIHGDNLEALKALLPEYENRIKCIYIDPPYNTGNENWVYNDNVNDPHIRKWLGKVVGSEVDDLTRHDKWLCMMYPRLVLLQRLLSEDGAIFISIDDNEQENLKKICDDIFGLGNFEGCIHWRRRHNQPNDKTKLIGLVAEFILVYAKDSKRLKECGVGKIKLSGNFKNPDNDVKGSWISNPWKAAKGRGGCKYEITTPTGKVLSEIWYGTYETFCQYLNEGRVHWTKNGEGIPRIKMYKFEAEEQGQCATNWWTNDFAGCNQDADKELKQIFYEVTDHKPFDTPKPSSLLEIIIGLSSDENSIILDSFAGSGTTAHAVLNLNKQDGGKRKFILCEMSDYAETITAERTRRVITGYDFKGELEEELFCEELTLKNLSSGEVLIERAKNIIEESKEKYDKISKPTIKDNCLKVIGTKVFDERMEGLGGSFDFYELGETIFDPVTGNLNDNADTEAIRRYVWFSETNSAYIQPSKDAHPYLLGTYQHNNYYFYYKKGEETCLDWDFLNTFTQKDKAEMYIIYADRCVLTEEEMMRLNIRFKKIPRDIKRV